MKVRSENQLGYMLTRYPEFVKRCLGFKKKRKKIVGGDPNDHNRTYGPRILKKEAHIGLIGKLALYLYRFLDKELIIGMTFGPERMTFAGLFFVSYPTK